jgi:hypothetical protein
VLTILPIAYSGDAQRLRLGNGRRGHVSLIGSLIGKRLLVWRRQIVGQHLGQNEQRHQIGRLTVSSSEFPCRRLWHAALPAHASVGAAATRDGIPSRLLEMPPPFDVQAQAIEAQVSDSE